MNCEARMNRLFAADGKCFDVAIDHGFFNEHAFLAGIERIGEAVATIVRAGPDAVQLTAGQARHLQAIPGRKPALVMRVDVANCYGRGVSGALFSEMIDDAVGQAVAADAACICVNLLLLADQPELHRQCVANICKLKPACERAGMPMMVEPLVMKQAPGGGYTTDTGLEKILALVRQAVELGGHVIKADVCDDVTQYHRVVEIAGGVPVLVRGGGKVDDDELLARTRELMAQGAAGIVYGRNVIQHRNPSAVTAALMAMVHDNATVEQGRAILSRK